MSLHPQFFDRYETLILQTLVGHTGVGGQPAGHGPRTASIHACPYRVPALYAGLVSSCRIAGGNVLSPTMASADSCPITAAVARCRATKRRWHVEQVSPDKNVNCRYTTAAFTMSPESVGLRRVVPTCPDDGLVCCFCSSAHSFALGLPSDPSSRRRPCRRLVLGCPVQWTGVGFPYRGLVPHKFGLKSIRGDSCDE